MQPLLSSAARSAYTEGRMHGALLLLCLLLGALGLVTRAAGATAPAQEWVALYPNPRGVFAGASAMAVDSDGNIFVTGRASADASPFTIGYVTVKYDGATGQPLWVARYIGPNAYGQAVALALDAAGNVYVTGYTQVDSTHLDRNFATVKYDGATGQQLWVATYDGPIHDDDEAVSVGVDTASNVYVTGFCRITDYDFDYATIKYDGATGQQLWLARYNGPTNGMDLARALALDSTGNVYVTGSSPGVGSSNDFATVKYDGATGQQLWIARYDGPRHLADEAVALTVDKTSNVYVTGYSHVVPDGFNENYTTVKYDGATGQQLWSASYDAGGGIDEATAVAVDAANNVYVTGQSGIFASADFATVKYDGATGQQLWVARYDGPAHSGDGARALTVDGMGNVYVTGYSYGADTFYDYLTLDYDATTGTELWSRRYSSPGAEEELASAVAVDGAGNVYVTGETYSVYGFATVKYRQSAPTLTDAAVTNITTTGAILTWNTGTRATSQVEYGTTTAYGATQADGAYVTAHSVPLTGLTPGTRYYYRVSSSLVDGTELGPVTGSFTTLTAAPTLTWGAPSPTPNAADWNNTPVDLPFTVTPADAGSINPPSPLHLTAEGWNVTGTVTVTDAAGNTTAFTSPPVRIDRTAPHTAATVAGTGGQNGWYVRPVTVHLEGADALSGVAATYYQLDGGAAQTFTENLALTALGTHQLQCWSVDRAGNTEATQSLTLRLEAAAPVVTIQAQPTSPNTPNSKTATVTVSGTVFGTQAGLAAGQTRYAVTDRTGKTVATGAVKLDKRGRYHFTVRLLGPAKGGAPLPYVVTVQAIDLGGARGQASAVVTVR